MIKLRDICRFQSGGTPSKGNAAYFNGKIPWITTAALNGGFIGTDDATAWITDKAIAESVAKIVPAYSIMVGTRVGIGKVAINCVPMSTSQDIISLLDIDETMWDREYITRMIAANNQYLISQARGATIKGIKIDVLADLMLPEITLEQQEQIARVLDKLDKTIEDHKEQAHYFDQLVKSRFIELFGEADRFEAAPLDDSVDEMFIGPFGSSLKNECFVAAEQGYCMVYEQKHAIKKTMDVDTRFVDEKKYKELRRFTVQGGDIIVSCRGTIGETFIVPEGAPLGIMHPSIMKIRLKAAAYNQVFFNHLLQTVLDRHEADANGSGVKMAITATALGKERFIRPPMELQEQFAAFVKQTDKSKLAVQKSLEELEILKKSLMQQYFG